MKLSTLFRLEENLHLDKNTLVVLRWIALVGQLTAINLVYNYLGLKFLIQESHAIIFIGLITNLYLQFGVKANQLKDVYSSFFLIYDLCQLSVLLYLTGGISNPFSLLLIVPTIVSSTFLSMGTTIILGIITISSLSLLTKFYLPLPGISEYSFNFPAYYLIGTLISTIVGLIFLSYFGIRFSGETKKRSEALNKLQQVIAKEYELECLGGQAAAAAHIVKKISQKKIIKDKFMSEVKFDDLLIEILRSFMETSGKEIKLTSNNDTNRIDIKRSPEIIYGLRNFIGNAVKFSTKRVQVEIKSDKNFINILIDDDGPGFPDDVIKVLGEPYIKSKSKEVNTKSGLGLGTFLGKTLLERQGAKITFSNNGNNSGASVKISWEVKILNFNF